MNTYKNAYLDVNSIIVTADAPIIRVKRVEGIVGGGKWHQPRGRVLFKETFETTLKRVAFAKTNLKVELYYHSLKESLVGICDDLKRNPREHMVSIAFLCRIVSGESKLGAKVDTVESFWSRSERFGDCF